MNLIVSGAIQRKNAFDLESGQHYEKARLSLINLDEHTETVLKDYISPAGCCSQKYPSIRFTCFTLQNDKLYIATSTEVFVFSYPGLETIKYHTLPCFNDIHHVYPVHNKIAVVSTGLDMVVFLDYETLAPVKYLNVLGKKPWYKYDKKVDYRKINSTKPHESHPNYLFQINGDLWVTRFQQNDIACLKNLNKTIRINKKCIHDGCVRGIFCYLTSVDGCIIKVDMKKGNVVEQIDLSDYDTKYKGLGWCRGIYVDGDIAYTGFSFIRPTKWKENIANIYLRIMKTGERLPPARIIAFDLKKKKVVDQFIFAPDSLAAIFSIHKS